MMTTIRKKLQDILRKKFKYQTNNDRGRGTTLIKPNASVLHYKSNDIVTDLAVNIDRSMFRYDNGKSAIAIYLTKYKHDKSSNKYDKLDDLSGYISLEELGLIHKIACEIKAESDILAGLNVKESKKCITKYWPNYIIQTDEHSEPWRCYSYDCCLSMEDALRAIEKQRENYRVLSAWIDEQNDNIIKTVFHECYLDAVGNINTKRRTNI